MNFSKITFLLILLFLLPNINSQGEINLQQENKIEVIWVADTTIYAESFPVVLASHNRIFANITFETSYMTYNDSKVLDNNGVIFWIDVPNTQSGSDVLIIYSEMELLGNYTFVWEKSDPFENGPISISYSHRTFSYWVGHSILNAEYFDNNTFSIDYSTTVSELSEVSAAPYDNDFDISDNYDFSSLMSAINISNAHKFQSWRYHGLVGLCDGGGFSKELILGFEERTVVLEIIVNNDSCFGTRTVHSDPMIAGIFSTLDSISRTNINNSMSESKDESLVNFQFWGFSFIVLIILKKVKKV